MDPWETNFQELQKFCKKHSRFPRTADGGKLGSWFNNQRGRFRNLGDLSEKWVERRERMRLLGVNFETASLSRVNRSFWSSMPPPLLPPPLINNNNSTSSDNSVMLLEEDEEEKDSVSTSFQVIQYDPSNDACHICKDQVTACVVIGNDGFQWCSLADESAGVAKAFWTSPPLSEEDLIISKVGILDHYPQELHKKFITFFNPQSLKKYVFGKDSNLFTVATAKEAARARGRLGLSSRFKIFALSVVKKQSDGLKHLLKHLPCTLVEVGRDVFDLIDANEGIGLDRLCGLNSAKMITKSNDVVMIDCGSYTTITKSNDVVMIDCGSYTTIQVLASNVIQGGSIQSGLRLQLENFKDLYHPTVTLDDLINYINSNKRKLPLMEKESKNNIICGTLGSFYRNVEKYIIDYMKQTGNKKIQVVITGREGIILYSLLADYDGDSGETSSLEQLKSSQHLSSKANFDTEDINIVYEENLLSNGLAELILEEVGPLASSEIKEDIGHSTSPPAEEDEIKMPFIPPQNKLSSTKKSKSKFHPKDFIGRRLCKHFGDDLFFGMIKSYKDPWFKVVYDDGDSEDCDLEELKELLELYDQEKEEDDFEDEVVCVNKNKNADKVALNSSEGSNGGAKKLRDPLEDNSSPRSLNDKPSSTKNLKKKEFHPNDFIGRRSCKYFGEGLFFGTIKSYKHPLFKVVYDDGDSEEYSVNELKESLKLYEKEKEEDDFVEARESSNKNAAKSKAVAYPVESFGSTRKLRDRRGSTSSRNSNEDSDNESLAENKHAVKTTTDSRNKRSDPRYSQRTRKKRFSYSEYSNNDSDDNDSESSEKLTLRTSQRRSKRPVKESASISRRSLRKRSRRSPISKYVIDSEDPDTDDSESTCDEASL